MVTHELPLRFKGRTWHCERVYRQRSQVVFALFIAGGLFHAIDREPEAREGTRSR